MKHLYPHYTTTQWLQVLFLLCFISYLVWNEHRASILIRSEIALHRNAYLQGELIKINRRQGNALEIIILGAHRLPTYEAEPRLTIGEWNTILDDRGERKEEGQ